MSNRASRLKPILFLAWILGVYIYYAREIFMHKVLPILQGIS